jgi:hypothetical protein
MNYSLDTSGEEGLELLQKIKILQPALPVILITGWGSIELAVKGMRMGAFNFVTKPWNNDSLLSTLAAAVAMHQPEPEPASGRKELNSRFSFEKIVGESPPLVKVLQTVSRIATTDAPVLITGESGTGKELIAEAIHQNSMRSKAPFVKVNLGGISGSLFESEMFGHRKGAFTDAYADRIGRFELAQGGTIFLDEIAELGSGLPGKTVAGFTGENLRSTWRQQTPPGQCARNLCHQPQPKANGREGPVSRRPVLPDQCDLSRIAPFARTTHRYRYSCTPFCPPAYTKPTTAGSIFFS